MQATTMAGRQCLSPAQQQAVNELLEGIATGDVVALRGDCGLGKTTVLDFLHRKAGGALIGMTEFMSALDRRAGSIEEALAHLIASTLEDHGLVLMDDLDLIVDVVE